MYLKLFMKDRSYTKRGYIFSTTQPDSRTCRAVLENSHVL